DGLKGDAIDEGARIIRVADSVEAMAHERPYRKGYPIRRVMDELRKCSGTALDPGVVECALALLSEGGKEFLEAQPGNDVFQAELDFNALLSDDDQERGPLL
ncbi:MAG: HD-GYP domain-containing protein, partial [Myxococcota bacterium]